MKRHTLIHAAAGGQSICLRTVSRSGRSPHSFYILRGELEQLQHRDKIIVQDIRSFAVLCRNADNGMLRMEFTWLGGSGPHVSGFRETLDVPFDGFMAFVHDSAGEDGPSEWRSLCADSSWKQPQIVFKSRKNLREALGNRMVRRKLVRCLRDGFKWPGAERVEFYDDFLQYSFVFHEIRDGKTAVTGGLILHRQDSMEKAYYSVHT